MAAAGRPAGDVIIVRYADGFVPGFPQRGDTGGCRMDQTARLAKDGLARHLEKTRLIESGRFAAANRRERGQGQPETLDFFGFPHYCGRRCEGRFQLGGKPSAKRMSRAPARACAKRPAELLRGVGQQPLPRAVPEPTPMDLEASPAQSLVASAGGMGLAEGAMQSALAAN